MRATELVSEHVFVSMFSFVPSHLGSCTPAPPECLFGLVLVGSAFQPNMADVQLQDFAGQGPVLFPEGIEVDAKDLGSNNFAVENL